MNRVVPLGVEGIGLEMAFRELRVGDTSAPGVDAGVDLASHAQPALDAVALQREHLREPHGHQVRPRRQWRPLLPRLTVSQLRREGQRRAAPSGPRGPLFPP